MEFSESSTKAQKAYIESVSRNYENVAYFDVHSYSQLFMYPYGYGRKKPTNYKLLDEIASTCVAAIESVHGTEFTSGQMFQTIYPASGTTTDYFYDSGIPCAFSVELRDLGEYGFLLPADQIKPVAEEMAAAYAIVMHAVVDGQCAME